MTPSPNPSSEELTNPPEFEGFKTGDDLKAKVNKIYTDYWQNKTDGQGMQQAIMQLIDAARIDELERLQYAITKEKILSGWGVIEERIAQLRKPHD